MKFSVLTIFPNMFDSVLNESILKRAIGKKIIEIELINVRDFSKDRTHRIDRPPVGGGAGLIMQCQPIYDALGAVKTPNSHVVLLSPRGKMYNQAIAKQFKNIDHLILICGHYEGIDERIYNYADEIISIGDYVLTGGEIAAMSIIDSVARLKEGVINTESLNDESFENGLLEYPQYAEPYDFKGDKIPQILYSGNHSAIQKYRLYQSLKLTKELRPDLFAKHELTKSEKKLMDEYANENIPKFEAEAIKKGIKFMKDK